MPAQLPDTTVPTTASHWLERFLINPLDALSNKLGRALAWLTLAMAIATASMVVVRYGLGLNSIALQESVIYMHSLVFLLAAGYTLKAEGHVRVDILYRNFGPSAQAWVNAAGAILCLLPFSGFLFFISWQFVTTSWLHFEGSTEPGGIPAVFLLKSLLPLSAVLLGLQGLAEILRNLLQLLRGADNA